jgi:SAM-dependent methyltransferase
MVIPESDVVLREMLRVLKPGGRVALATWPPTSPVGEFIRRLEHYGEVVFDRKPPLRMSSWGKTDFLRDQLDAVATDIRFDIYQIRAPYMSPRHHVLHVQENGPKTGPRPELTEEQKRRAAGLKLDMLDTVIPFFDEDESVVRLNCLLTRATKKG